MEVIPLASDPKSWTDLGMDWNNPDPRQSKYIRALYLAICERLGAAMASAWSFNRMSSTSLGSPGCFKVINTKFADWCVKALSSVAPRYYRKDHQYESDWSDFPMSWHWGDVIDNDSKRAFAFPVPGHTTKGDSEWLKAMYKAVNVLRYPYATELNYIQFNRTQGYHDPKTIQESLQKTLERYQEYREDYPIYVRGYRGYRDQPFSTTQFTPSKRTGRQRTFRPSDPEVKLYAGGFELAAWSGNTDYKYVWDSDEDDFIHGYCGYISGRGIEITEVTNPLTGRKCNLIPIAVVTKKTDPVSYSKELQSTKFSGFGGLKEGLNELAATPLPLSSSIKIGPSADTFQNIAMNTTTPQTEYEYEAYDPRPKKAPYGYYRAKLRRSAVAGMRGRLILILDFGIDGGFRFFAG